eukprot:1132290-Prymnesium_polylepis.1
MIGEHQAQHHHKVALGLVAQRAAELDGERLEVPKRMADLQQRTRKRHRARAALHRAAPRGAHDRLALARPAVAARKLVLEPVQPAEALEVRHADEKVAEQG